jgi:hypothetical protein
MKGTSGTTPLPWQVFKIIQGVASYDFRGKPNDGTISIPVQVVIGFNG